MQGLQDGIELIGLIDCRSLRSLLFLPGSVTGLVCVSCPVKSFDGLPAGAILFTAWNAAYHDIKTGLAEAIRLEREKRCPEQDKPQERGPFEMLDLPYSVISLSSVPDTIAHLRVTSNQNITALTGIPKGIKDS
jgi:hypothetical protein